MQKILFSSFLLAGFILFCFSQDTQRHGRDTLLPAYRSAHQLYLQAGRQLQQAGDNEQLLAGADETYQKALTAYKRPVMIHWPCLYNCVQVLFITISTALKQQKKITWPPRL